YNQSGGTQVVEVKPDGTQISLAFGLSSPFGVAVDGAGDVFIADSMNNRVLKLTPGLVVTVRVPTTISVSASSTAVYGQSVTLTATVTVPSGDPTPTAADGTVSFYDGTTLLGTTTLS